jgi:hypothetical protein
MRITEAAWRDVDTTTIRKCWQKAGIVPDVAAPSASTQPTIPISALLNNSALQTDPIIHAESQVEQVLDDLVATGVCQKENRMDINSLLNLVGESHVLTETSDQEIYQAVMDAVEAWENIEMSGWDDGDGNTVKPTMAILLSPIQPAVMFIDHQQLHRHHQWPSRMQNRSSIAFIQEAAPPSWGKDHERYSFDRLFLIITNLK